MAHLQPWRNRSKGIFEGKAMSKYRSSAILYRAISSFMENPHIRPTGILTVVTVNVIGELFVGWTAFIFQQTALAAVFPATPDLFAGRCSKFLAAVDAVLKDGPFARPRPTLSGAILSVFTGSDELLSARQAFFLKFTQGLFSLTGPRADECLTSLQPILMS